jgi:phosphoacetylglucosamine mutase
LKLSNIYVGDAISNMLMIEAILRDKGMSIEKFSQIYKEYPSRMFKVKVNDRSMFKTIKDESRLTEPLALQAFIDETVALSKQGRAFVRPSGTEDVLRLYVEADTYHEVDAIANSILMEIDSKYRIT